MRPRLLSFSGILCFILLSFFSQNAVAQYCLPSFSFGCNLFLDIDDVNTFLITGVSSTAINDNNTGCVGSGAYDDRTSQSVTLNQGGSYTVSINSNTTDDNTQVFIDLNNDNDFSSAESVGGMNGIASSPALSTFTINIPGTASIGSHRMRVIVNADDMYPSLDPCADIFSFYAFGEVHDYTVVINGTTTCAAVTGLAASAITASAATINWTAVTGAIGYEWTVNTTATDPTVAGTATTLTTANPTGLTASTTYYAHVRTKCSATSFSAWVTIPFTTLSTTACAPVTGLAASAITASAATISWTAVTGAIGYEWTVNTTATDPTVAGTATTLTTANATGLTASTTYYAHVRTKCSATSFSAWVTIPFTTISSTACAPVTGLTASAITTSAATISWTAVTGATGYEWVVNTTAADPAGAGTATTLTTATASGLASGTAYYAHVRTNCGTGFSAWVTIPFTTLGSASACSPVSGIAISSITTTSAIVSWSAVPGSVGYKYVVNTTATDPSVPGTFTTLTTTTATGLTPNTTYYAHVKDSCGPGSVSVWVTISFTTLSAGCGPVTLITPSAITTTSATISWTAVAGSHGYQYVVDNSVTDPTGSGTTTTLTIANITGLTAGTTYYAHVRDSCAPGSFSAWTTVPFTTLSLTGCNAVTTLAASSITASSATINWTMAAGAIGAEYTINTIAADPAAADTNITPSSAIIHGLTAATTYYAHVRDSCSVTSFSAWVTIPFTTLAPSGIKEISAANTILLTAFPNPVRNVLMIKAEGNTGANAQLQLMDITGKLISTTAVAGHTTAINMEELPAGMYLIRYTDMASRQTIKISKQ